MLVLAGGPPESGTGNLTLNALLGDGDIRPGERTVFVHTGGLPGLFGHPVAQELASADG